MPDVVCRPLSLRLNRGVVALLVGFAALGGPVRAQQAPVIAGYERFHTKGEGNAVAGGQVLLGELSCLSCHAPDPATEALVPRKSAPVLDGVGARVKSAYLQKYLTDPTATKPGTAMPDVLAALPSRDRAEAVEALVHFLASTGTPKSEKPQKKLVAVGRDLYHKVGCVACHGTRDAAGERDQIFATSVPLGDLKAKYHLASLRTFLENPHATRPSGRMPSLLNAKEAAAVANYLLQGAGELAQPANLKFAYYEGSWDNLPDFDQLKPRLEGTSAGFDLGLALRSSDFALKFDGFLRIDRDGEYRFHLTSDDGSKLWIDGRLVVANDGIHATTTKAAAVTLAKGVHPFKVGVFQGGGEVVLEVDIEGAGLSRRSVAPMVTLTPEGNPEVKKAETAKSDVPLVVQPALAEKGRALFESAGCASCHTLNLGQKVASTVKAPPLAKLQSDRGCLDPKLRPGVPRYPLSSAQRSTLAAALKTLPFAKPAPAEIVARTMTAFNCFACHERNQVGGVTEELNPYFATAQPEMGDEGRVPPSLTGVGAKLNGEYLRHILDRGAHDRPYMFTRMPGFGNANVGGLVALLENLDPAEPAPKVGFDLAPAKVKAEARALVGAGALACIKCHTFAGHKAEGVQGIDMAVMTQRLRKGWFYHYLLNPNKYRPGTRMPASWPDGQVLLPKYLGGTADRQIEGIWVFLADGAKAPLPPGMNKRAIPLEPTTEAIIYRNFIEGAGPRAIGVGYPEQAHLAFDANYLRLAMIWQGAFIDASRHWTDRGSGFEPPAGDNVIHFTKAVDFAVLPRPDAPWPTESARKLTGYQFQGYRVTKDERPTFLYTVAGATVEDFPNAVAGKAGPAIRRTLTLVASGPGENLFFRAAAGSKIVAVGDGWYQVNGEWKVRVESAAPPQVRQSGGQSELLVPVRFKDGQARIVQEFQW
jgi:mono/diheme cytochrome c family protein